MTTSFHLPRARHEYLLREVELRGGVNAAEAAEALGVSQVTVRRDIVELAEQGRLLRVHGGAIAATAPAAPQPARADIGVIVPGAVGHFPVIVRGMQAAALSRRARIILATSHYQPELEQRQVERLVATGVSGIVLAPTLRGRSEQQLAEWLTGIPVPVVLLERRLRALALAAYDSARTDHVRGAALAVEHLAGLGHRRVGLAVFARTPTAPLIREGHEEAVERLGLGEAPVVDLPKGEDDGLDARLGELLDALRASGTSAVIVHTDVHAARLVELASDRGVRVPGDLAIVAYDDDTASLAMVPLTAVTAPRRELGQEVLRVIAERIEQSDDERTAPRRLTILPSLTVRESCGAAV